MLHKFRYAKPTSRSELLSLLKDSGTEARLLAGGTDLLVNIRAGVLKPSLLIDMKKVPDFQGISWSEAEGLVLRPAVTINEVLQDKVVRQRFPLLAECAHDLASYQVRNRATVIGNIVNASPCSDMAPGLLCLGAVAVLSSKEGERRMPLAEFFTGVKKTVLRPDEILERLVIPEASAGARGSYRKLKRINGHDLGIVGVALCRQGGKLSLGISSSAPTPVLVDGLSEKDDEAKVVAAAMKAISPISDVRCSKEYREFMVATFVRRLYREVL
jgi:CO/xanthine dehydrogenase FAD-binding subunit